MKFCAVFLGVVAISAAMPQYQVRLAFQNPAGVTFTGAGYESNFQVPQYEQYFQQQQQRQHEQQQQQQQQQQSAEAPAGRQAAEDQDTEVISAAPAADEPQQQEQQQEQPAPQPEEQQQQEQQQQQQQQEQQQQQQQQEQQQQQQQQEQQQQQQAQEPAAEQPTGAAPAEQGASAPPPPAYPYAPPPSIPYSQYHREVVHQAPVHYAAAHAVHHYSAHPAHAHVQYAHAPVAHHAVHHAAAPAVHYAAAPAAVHHHQKIGYAATPVLTKVAGVANVPVTKLAYTQGVTQKLVDVARPAVTTRKVKVRRPALRQEFYDIEHRIIIRPAGSATLELSQPISKEQKGPAVLTPTNFVHHAPVVRYGLSRQIVDGQNVARSAVAVSPAPESRAASPSAEPSAAPSAAPRAGPSSTSVPATAEPSAQSYEAPQARQAEFDTDVIENNEQQDQPQEAPAQDAPVNPAPGAPSAAPAQQGLITPHMPIELQNRLLQLLTAQGGTVTEVLGEDGRPADSASVLQVAEALGEHGLQGSERTTTRRIVITRPIETVQDIEVQEPATKIQRVAVNQPTLFKTAIPAVARVPVAIPAVKHVATPVVKTTYAHHPAAAYYQQYQQYPQQYHNYQPAYVH